MLRQTPLQKKSKVIFLDIFLEGDDNMSLCLLLLLVILFYSKTVRKI